MNLALDTNRYTDLARGEPDVVRRVSSATSVYLPFIVLGELRAGFLHGTRAAANETTLSLFLGKPGVSVLYANDQTTLRYAELVLHLRQRGTMIPTNDLWIAALTIQHGLTLYARDKHFDHLPQLSRI